MHIYFLGTWVTKFNMKQWLRQVTLLKTKHSLMLINWQDGHELLYLMLILVSLLVFLARYCGWILLSFVSSTPSWIV